MITFDLWSERGGLTGSITVPAPTRWYRRWALRFSAWLWLKVAQAEQA